MKRRRHRKRGSRTLRAIRLWNSADATKAIPYLRSVVGSLREHWLEAQSKRREAELLAARPGRADRRRLLAGELLGETQHDAEVRFEDALEELMRIDAYLLDPVRGIVLIPFR